MVLSQPTSSTTPSIGWPRICSSTDIAAMLRNIIAVGRNALSEAEKTGTSTGKAAGLEDAVLHPLREVAQMRVAGRQLGPGVEDADHRAAVEQVVRQALVLHPAAVVDVVLGGAAEPFLRAQFPGPFRGFESHP